MKGERGPARRRSAAKLVVRAPILTSKWESGFSNPALGIDDHLQRLIIRSLGKGVVGRENFRHFEVMGDQTLRIDFARLHRPKQHGCRDGIYQSGPQGDVMGPQPLQVEIHLCSVNTEDRDGSTDSDNRLTKGKCARNTHRLDGRVHPATIGQSHNTIRRISDATVHSVGGTELSRNGQAVLVQIDRYDPPRRVELRSQKRSQADRTGAHDGQGISG